MDGDSRHGHRRRDHRHPPAVREADGVRDLVIHHWCRRGALGLRPSGLVGAPGVQYRHADMLSPDRRATRVRPFVGPRKGENETLAVPILILRPAGEGMRRSAERRRPSLRRFQGSRVPHGNSRRKQCGGFLMSYKLLGLAVAAIGGTALAEPAFAQANEQFLPALVYRTGPYAPNGVPFANGAVDYWTMINERDGGINGVKIASEECETGYATDKGVECYERLKG